MKRVKIISIIISILIIACFPINVQKNIEITKAVKAEETTEIIKKTQTISTSYPNIFSVTINHKPFSLKAKTNGNGKLNFYAVDDKVIHIDRNTGIITPIGYGSTDIRIIADETDTYKRAEKKIRLSVIPKKVKIKSISSPSKGKIRLKWTKDSTIDYYEIDIARKKKWDKTGVSASFTLFRKGNKVYSYIKKNGKLVKKKTKDGFREFVNFKSKKVWYVRIRAFVRAKYNKTEDGFICTDYSIKKVKVK